MCSVAVNTDSSTNAFALRVSPNVYHLHVHGVHCTGGFLFSFSFQRCLPSFSYADGLRFEPYMFSRKPVCEVATIVLGRTA